MDHGKAENYHPVKSVQRLRERHPIGGSAGGEKTNLTDEHGPVVETKVTKHDDGTAHVTARHSKGHEEIHQHPDIASAHEHANTLMSGGDSMDSAKPGEEGGEEECPHCGGKMDAGKCTQCGYEEGEETGMNDHDADDGY